jgi:hypothetical protein
MSDHADPATQIALYRRIIALRLAPEEVRAAAAQLLVELERKATDRDVDLLSRPSI